ncbi:MAG TPA: hypothetical protein PLV62_08095, partial [Spirochaetota bacterium]|nr:hypothetical protein [Spirochaetota bacterium]
LLIFDAGQLVASNSSASCYALNVVDRKKTFVNNLLYRFTMAMRQTPDRYFYDVCTIIQL